MKYLFKRGLGITGMILVAIILYQRSQNKITDGNITIYFSIILVLLGIALYLEKRFKENM